MKLLVSDYDGTIKGFNDNMDETSKNIQKFMDKGNLFAISTGRCLLSILKQTNNYNIPYDYLMCNDGSTAFDKDLKTIYTNPINEKTLDELIVCLEKLVGIKYSLFNESTYTNKKENIISIEIIDYNILRLRIILENITKYFPNIIHNQYYFLGYIKNECSKALGIHKLIDSQSLKVDDIICVGDGPNDISMLKAYNGYKVATSFPSLYFKGIKTTKDFNTLIKRL